MIFGFLCDLHLRPDRPRCRKDLDWIKTQEQTLDSIASLIEKEKCKLLIGGDIFHRPIVPEEIVNMFLNFCGKTNGVSIIAGNHDLPKHSIDLINQSSIGILMNIKNLKNKKLVPMSEYENVSWANFGEEIHNPGKEILVIHRMVFESPNDVPPHVDAPTAEELLDEYPGYKWILTGDCHKPFHFKKNGRHVLNPGHMNIQKSNELDKPIFFVFDTETELVKKIEIPNNFELVTDSYIVQEEEREERISSFVELIRSASEENSFSLDFEENLEREIDINKTNLGSEVISMVRRIKEEALNDN